MIRIDPTTDNTVYNPIGPQGQWFQHRWGKRDYPTVSLQWDSIRSIVTPLTEVHLHSVYGDPCTWGPIVDLAKMLGNRLCVITYGQVESTLIESLNHYNANLTYKLDGLYNLCGKVYLGAEWDSVWNNITCTKNAHIEFLLCGHNQHQLATLTNIKRDDATIHVKQQTAIEPIITANSEWLYDVSPAEMQRNLVRHLQTFNMLRTFTKKPSGRSILNKPLLPAPSTTEFIKNGKYISPTGHVFENRDVFELFMHMLCTDWTITPQMLSNDYIRYICDAAHESRNAKSISSQLSSTNVA